VKKRKITHQLWAAASVVPMAAWMVGRRVRWLAGATADQTAPQRVVLWVALTAATSVGHLVPVKRKEKRVSHEV